MRSLTFAEADALQANRDPVFVSAYVKTTCPFWTEEAFNQNIDKCLEAEMRRFRTETPQEKSREFLKGENIASAIIVARMNKENILTNIGEAISQFKGEDPSDELIATVRAEIQKIPAEIIEKVNLKVVPFFISPKSTDHAKKIYTIILSEFFIQPLLRSIQERYPYDEARRTREKMLVRRVMNNRAIQSAVAEKMAIFGDSQIDKTISKMLLIFPLLIASIGRHEPFMDWLDLDESQHHKEQLQSFSEGMIQACALYGTTPPEKIQKELREAIVGRKPIVGKGLIKGLKDGDTAPLRDFLIKYPAVGWHIMKNASKLNGATISYANYLRQHREIPQGDAVNDASASINMVLSPQLLTSVGKIHEAVKLALQTYSDACSGFDKVVGEQPGVCELQSLMSTITKIERSLVSKSQAADNAITAWGALEHVFKKVTKVIGGFISAEKESASFLTLFSGNSTHQLSILFQSLQDIKASEIDHFASIIEVMGKIHGLDITLGNGGARFIQRATALEEEQLIEVPAFGSAQGPTS